MPINNINQDNLSSVHNLFLENIDINSSLTTENERIIYTKEIHGEIGFFEKFFLKKYISQVEGDFEEIIKNMGFNDQLKKPINIFIKKLTTPHKIDPLSKNDIYHGLGNWLLQLKKLKEPICPMIKDEVENMLQDLEYCVSGSLIRIKKTCHNINFNKNSALPEKLENEKIKIGNEIISWFLKKHHENIAEIMEIHYINAYKLQLKSDSWNLGKLENDPFYSEAIKEKTQRLLPYLLAELNDKCHISALIKHYGDCIYEQLLNITKNEKNYTIEGNQSYLTEEGYNAVVSSNHVISYKIKEWEILEESHNIGQFYLLPNTGVIYCALATALAEAQVGYEIKNEISTPDVDLISAAGTYWFVNKRLKTRSLITLETLQKHKIGSTLSDECLHYAINNTSADKFLDFLDPAWITDPERFFNYIANDKIYKALVDSIGKQIIDEKFNDIFKNNIIMLAASYNDKNSVMKFIKIKSLDINHVNELGHTAFIYAIKNIGHVEMVKIIRENRANVESENQNFDADLTTNVTSQRFDLAEILLGHGANVNHVTHDGKTALSLAVNKSDINMAKFLLDNGAIVDHVYMNDFTPLITAIINNDNAMTELLIDYGASVHDTDENGWTALLYAVEQNNIDMVKLILNKKPDVNHLNKDGMPALYLAFHTKMLK